MAEDGTSKAVDGSAATPAGPPRVFSVGHSNVAVTAFLDLLARHRIEVVADVRSSPRSRFVPHFDAKPLRSALAQAGIRYVPLGEQLGGRPVGDEFYDADGYVLYARVARSPAFVAGIERLVRGAGRYRVAMMCGEEDPARCHRRLLVGRVLADRGVDVAHIRHDGTIQTEQDLIAAERATAPAVQPLLFQPVSEERAWRSSRSVSRRRARKDSSAP